ncbi:hypothetical protein FB562_2699 [Homoserinimonas aerilata]|uniref:Uncharacterized protein n=1 Tax=Homoserinimonas aerilata TaxID=1162970 RepID=A0A542XX07_9MICO|nr:hypothetical protein [Homoserinimonas aerilata]TQL40366.1 hypothetical protein FB562_2699 [Homoserinimonas aerilata]
MDAPLYLSREARMLGTDRELRARFERGELLRLRPGVYTSATAWARLAGDVRHRLFVRAAAAVSPFGAQFSHESAAALWRLPILGAWPSTAHRLTQPSPGGTSRVGIRHHGLGLDTHPVEIDGVTVTSLTRTLLDMATSTNFMRAVVTIDDGLRPPEKGDFRYGEGVEAPTKEELLDLLRLRLSFRGSARASRAIEFADGRSGSPRESRFRVQCAALRLPAPELQVEFRDEEGLIGYADFFWPHLGLIVEVDGAIKYGAGRRYRQDLTPHELLLREKDREDRMRRVVTDFARPPARILDDRRLLGPYLARHGLVPVR